MSGKSIWIINEYAGSPYHGMEFRHYYLSKELIKLGYRVSIISASYSHLYKNLPQTKGKFTFQNIDGIQYLWIKVPHYTQSHSRKRVLKWLIYTSSLFQLPIKKLDNPDYIIVSPMQTMPVFPAYRWTKKFNSKLIFEVKDIWPLSIIELGNYSPAHPFIKLLKYFENFAIKKSDAIVSVLPNYGQYLKDEGFEKPFHYIPNGIDLNEVQNIEPLDASIKNKIPKDRFIVGYAGTIGTANAMNYFIEAARILKNNDNILFVLVGEGSEKENLIQQSRDLKNILFLPSIPKRQIQNFLNLINVCYVGLQKKNLYKYGVSLNKLFDYMYSGKPILFSTDSPNNVVELARCGIIAEASNPKSIADAVIYLYNMTEEERSEMGMNGKKYVLEHHCFEILAKKYDAILRTL